MGKPVVSDFTKNVFTLISGTTLSQLFPFLVLPLLQRWFYTPEDFGILAIYVSFSLAIAKVSSLKFEMAIVLQKEESEAVLILKLASFIVLIFTLLTVVFIAVMMFFPGLVSSQNEFGLYIWLIPITVVSLGGYEVFNYWFNWRKKYKLMASSKVIQAGTAESFKVVFGLLKVPTGLIPGRVIGEFTALIYMILRFLREKPAEASASFKDLFRVAKRYKDFAFFSAPSVFLGGLIPVVYISLFNKYFGLEVTGVIGVSISYVGAAFGIISRSFGQVFYKKIAEITDNGILLRSYLKFAGRLALIALFVILLVYLIPQGLVTSMLGPKWIEMMPVLRILIIGLAFSFVSSSLSFIFIRLEKQKYMMFFDILHLAMVYLSIYLSVYLEAGLTETLWSYSIVQSVYYLFAILIAVTFIRNQGRA